MTEEWKPVPGYDGFYEVSDHGRVKSVSRVIVRSNGAPQTVRERILNSWVSGDKHVHVVLSRPGMRTYRSVHSLVMEAFIGEAPDGHEVRHVNGDPTDNHLLNLRYGTRSENMHDRVRHGEHHMAIKTHCKHGHEFTPENTYLTKDGGRACRTCRVDYRRRYEAKRIQPHV